MFDVWFVAEILLNESFHNVLVWNAWVHLMCVFACQECGSIVRLDVLLDCYRHSGWCGGSPESRIAVVTHCGFLFLTLSAFGHDCAQPVQVRSPFRFQSICVCMCGCHVAAAHAAVTCQQRCVCMETAGGVEDLLRWCTGRAAPRVRQLRDAQRGHHRRGWRR